MKTTPLKAIRKMCIHCTCGDMDWIRDCPSSDCSLHPYRMGKNPAYSEATRQKRREIAEKSGLGKKEMVDLR